MRVLVTGGSGFIGTNFIEDLVSHGNDVLNVDIKAPSIKSHTTHWAECDILDEAALSNILHDYKPTHVVHLAARTDTEGRHIDDYCANTEGTQNVLDAIKSTPSVERVIITSSQFVHQCQGIPAHDQDYAPHTVYGESKVLTEIFTREANLKCVWTIIRPTNIWGPWHARYPKEFWRVLKRGMYFHPGKQPVIRMYGYVGNVVHQIMKIIESRSEYVNHKVIYVGDKPINLLDWVNGFSDKLAGKKVTIVPRIMVRNLALIGDMLLLCRIKFPITSSRYKSMTTNNEIAMDETFELLGHPPYSLIEGIDITVQWLVKQDPQFWSS